MFFKTWVFVLLSAIVTGCGGRGQPKEAAEELILLDNPQSVEEVDDPPEPEQQPQIQRVTITPDSAGFEEVGMASWYGKEYAGSSTASGEPFDPKAMTAAHRTLPFGTKVQITNLSNQKTVIVVINDRGPFNDDLMMDLSEKAAEELGFKKQRMTKVGLKKIQ